MPSTLHWEVNQITIIWSPTSSHTLDFWYWYFIKVFANFIHSQMLCFACILSMLQNQDIFGLFVRQRHFKTRLWTLILTLKHKWLPVESIIKEIVLILTAPAQAVLCSSTIKPPSWIMTLWLQILSYMLVCRRVVSSLHLFCRMCGVWTWCYLLWQRCKSHAELSG